MLESVFSTVAGLKAWNFIQKRIQHRYFYVDIAKFLRTAFFYGTYLVADFNDHK